MNELSFDVGEPMVEEDAEGTRRVTPTLVEEGHHSRELRRLTGLEVQENQAPAGARRHRRLLRLPGRKEGRPLPQAGVAAGWIAGVYEPIVA